MEEKENRASVSYFIYEGAMARMERIIRILAYLLVAALVIFVINNVVWMKYVERQKAEAQVEEVITDAGIYKYPDSGSD